MTSEIQYLYCMNDIGGEDFITTSFSFSESGNIFFSHFIDGYHNNIFIFNFNQEEFDITRIKYVAIDYTLDPFISFNKKYTNSNALVVFKVKFVEQDFDRMTVTLLIEEKIKSFDLQSYKRDLKISNIINE